MPAASMEQLVALCKRRGFVFQASEIYGGLQGVYDYGPLGRRAEEQPEGGVVAFDGLRARRRGGPRLGHPHQPQGAALLGPRRHVLRPAGGLPAVQVALAGRSPRRRRLPPVRVEGPHRAAPLQPDVQDRRRAGGGRLLLRLSATRDRAVDLHQLQERARLDVRQAAVRGRPDRQGVPQRDHPAQLHLPGARVRTDGASSSSSNPARTTTGTTPGSRSASPGGSARGSTATTWSCSGFPRRNSRTTPRPRSMSCIVFRTGWRSWRESPTARTSIWAPTRGTSAIWRSTPPCPRTRTPTPVSRCSARRTGNGPCRSSSSRRPGSTGACSRS